MKIGNPADKPAPITAAGTPAAGRGGQGPGQANAIPVPPIRARRSNCRAPRRRCSGGPSNADFDAEKVARISQAIADGTFKINAEVIADKLIANAQELLTKFAS